MKGISAFTAGTFVLVSGLGIPPIPPIPSRPSIPDMSKASTKAKPIPRPQAPPWGRLLDRDTNGCLNLQRIGKCVQRPLELCRCEGLEAVPPVGDEYQQGYKLVDDRLPKGRQRLHRAAEYRRRIDGRARNTHSSRPLSSNSCPAAHAGAAAEALVMRLPHIGNGLVEERGFVFDPAMQIVVGIDPGAIQAVSVASGQGTRSPASW
ncbi:hypothetical protein QJQ45_009924 [Haematococcus lacustris]|nr:hypothetical protein QJQ45_009924 [Haematococcus lacustris]